MLDFPDFADSAARKKIADLRRLMDRSLTNTPHVKGRRASQLLGVLLASYRDAITGRLYENDDTLSTAYVQGDLFRLTLAAAFDVICNAEYIRGRVVNSKWIYCHRDDGNPKIYYSFLKQCPRCCLDKGLETRLSGAQHKPPSHHIGEITTVTTSLLLQFITAALDQPLEIATITKQSHDVDAIGFRDDLLVLFEIKSSPMVTFPLVANLNEPLLTDNEDGIREYGQHELVDMTSADSPVGITIPHRGWEIPLGARRVGEWPYDQLIAFFSVEGNFMRYLSAWIELYNAYKVPKRSRTGRVRALAYLVNGWGDEIDSNKTKPGLGRTDDIKKGTYQLLKFGAYYRDDSSRLKVRSALVANLDPLFLRGDYVDGLVDVRWALGRDFVHENGEYRIAEEFLRYLYDGIITFNQPTLNDPLVASLFDLDAVNSTLIAGQLDRFLQAWQNIGPDSIAEEITESHLF
jgi:hypothetical protein